MVEVELTIRPRGLAGRGLTSLEMPISSPAAIRYCHNYFPIYFPSKDNSSGVQNPVTLPFLEKDSTITTN